MSIQAEIINYYRDSIAPNHVIASPTGGATRTISPISRLEFNAGAFFACLFVVQKIAYSFFYLVQTMGTCGQNEESRNSLSKNAKEVLVYAGAIPLGWVGVLFPGMVNQTILGIPPAGCVLNV